MTWFGAATPIKAEQTETLHADMIPQDDVVVRNEGLSAPVPVTYSLRIYKEPDRIKLKGNVASEEDYKTFIGLVKANFPAIDLSDRVKIEEKPAEGEVKIGGLDFALKLLGYVEEGSASVDNNGLSLQGAAQTAMVLTEVNQLIKQDKPTGLPIKTIHISVPKKSWHASVKPDGVLRITGVVSSRKNQETLNRLARDKFPNLRVTDETAVSEKLETRWEEVAQQSLDLLGQLKQGSVEITEQAIHLRGLAPSSGAMEKISQIGSDLPSGFTLNSAVTTTTPTPSSAGVAAIPAQGTVLPR